MRQNTQPDSPKHSHVVHVARECSGIAPAGGVGDVVLQLGIEGARRGTPTTIVLPHYGPYSPDSARRAAENVSRALPWKDAEPQFLRAIETDLAMGYADAPDRAESVQLVPFEFRRRGPLRIVLVVADRFTQKSRPYTYSAAEAKAILMAPRSAPAVCGAELPPPDYPVREGVGHFDYFAMNVLLQKAALFWIEHVSSEDVAVHCHDAHTATLPMLAKLTDPPSPHAGSTFVVTAHNCGAAYRQRCLDREFVAAVTGVPEAAVEQCVIDGEFDPFGSAALYADRFTTVSDGYAWEIQRANLASSGADPDIVGLSHFLERNGIRLFGIVNGILPKLKGPETLQPEVSRADRVAGNFRWKPEFRRRFEKRISRARMPASWGVDPGNRLGDLKGMEPRGCLFTFVGRWSYQKGVDIIARAADEVLDLHRDAGLCVIGEGNQPFLRADLNDLVERFRGRVVVIEAFSERLAASVYAAGDFFLVPSRFEPCGLVDMIAQLNGNIPIVNQVGGLSKVIDGVTGIGYLATDDRHNVRHLVTAMRSAIALRANGDRYARMQRDADQAVRTKFGWDIVFDKYARLYGTGHSRTPRRGMRVPS